MYEITTHGSINCIHVCTGQIVDVEVVTAVPHIEGASEDMPSMLEVSVPAGQAAGVLHFEVARGSLLSDVKPVLVVDDPLAAKEINELQADSSGVSNFTLVASSSFSCIIYMCLDFVHQVTSDVWVLTLKPSSFKQWCWKRMWASSPQHLGRCLTTPMLHHRRIYYVLDFCDFDATGIDVDALLLDLGRVMDLKKAVRAAKSGSTGPVRPFAAADVAGVAQIARRLLVVAINKVWSVPSTHLFGHAVWYGALALGLDLSSMQLSDEFCF